MNSTASPAPEVSLDFMLNEPYQKILHWFFSYPQSEMTLSRLSEKLHIAKTTVNTYVNGMVEEGLLRKKIYGKTWNISCNLDHPLMKSRKIAFNFAMILEGYTKVLQDAIRGLVPHAKSVILFGSYRKGDDTENSDIDIAIEVSGEKTTRIREIKPLTLGHRKNVPVNLHLFSRKTVDINLFANIANGIVLEGFLEVNP